MPAKPVNPVIVTTLTQCVANFNAQAKEYAEADEWDFMDLAIIDAKHNQKCLISYMKSGDYDQLIQSLMYQDTHPREKVIWAMMQAGCYEDVTSNTAEFFC
jgi:hypothetical protein